MGYSAEIKEVHSKVSELDGRNQGCTKATLASDIGLTEIKMVYLNDMRTKLRQMKENKSPRMVSCARISLIQAWTLKVFSSPILLQGHWNTFWLVQSQKALLLPLTETQRKNAWSYSTFDMQGISYYRWWSTSQFLLPLIDPAWLQSVTPKKNWPSPKD